MCHTVTQQHETQDVNVVELVPVLLARYWMVTTKKIGKTHTRWDLLVINGVYNPYIYIYGLLNG